MDKNILNLKSDVKIKNRLSNMRTIFKITEQCYILGMVVVTRRMHLSKLRTVH